MTDASTTASESIALPGRKQWIIVAAASAAVLSIVAIPAVSGWFSSPAQLPASSTNGVKLTPEQLRELTIVVARDRSLGVTRETDGKIAVDEDRSTPVLSPYSGRVTRVLAEPGETVRRGQSLFAIQAVEYAEGSAGLTSALAGQASAREQLKIAQANEQRAGAVYREAGGALKDWQQAQNDLAAAKAAELTAAATVSAARSKLAILGARPVRRGGSAETIVSAPIGGVVVTRAVSPGQNITAGGDTPLFVVADVSRLWLVAQVPEGEVGGMRRGARVAVTTPAYPNRIFEAAIDYVAPVLDPETHRLPVRAAIANPDGTLKPGMFASFAIRTDTAAATFPTIPLEAVIREGDTSRIWVMAPDGTLRSRSVQTGNSADGEVQIVAGLRAGEPVVTRGAIFVDEAGQSR